MFCTPEQVARVPYTSPGMLDGSRLALHFLDKAELGELVYLFTTA